MPYTKNVASQRSPHLGQLLAVGIALLLTIAFAPINSFAQGGTQTYLPSAYGTCAIVGNTVRS
jgi:hypothetical protein